MVTPIFKSVRRASSGQLQANQHPPHYIQGCRKMGIETVDYVPQQRSHYTPPTSVWLSCPSLHWESKLCILQKIKHILDKHSYVGAVFLDLSRAFDTVYHQVLLAKWSNFSFSTDTIKWFKSYLENRKQCVMMAANSPAWATTVFLIHACLTHVLILTCMQMM